MIPNYIILVGRTLFNGEFGLPRCADHEFKASPQAKKAWASTASHARGAAVEERYLASPQAEKVDAR